MKNKALTSIILLLGFSFGLVETTLAVTKKPLIATITVEDALARAVIHNHSKVLKSLENEFNKSKTALEKFNLSQGRLIDSIKKIEGKDTLQRKIKSSPSEALLTWNLLDTGIAHLSNEITPNKLQIQKNNHQRVDQKIIQYTRRLYWQAVASQASKKPLNQLIQKTKSTLAKINQPDELNKPEYIAHKNELTEILSDLERLKNNNQVTHQSLLTLMGITSKKAYLLQTSDSASFHIPNLKNTTDQLITTAFSKNKFTQNSKSEDIKKRLKSISPNISFDWNDTSDANINTWISTGKNLSYELFLKTKQIKTTKKPNQDVSEIFNDHSLLASALFTKVHIGHTQYLADRNKLILSTCIYNLDEKLNALYKNDEKSSIKNDLSFIKIRRNQINKNHQHNLNYANLQYSLGLLTQNTINLDDDKARKKTNLIKALKENYLANTGINKLNNRVCFNLPSIEEEVEIALKERKAKADKIAHEKLMAENAKKKKIALALKTKMSTWVMKQNPKHLTLELLSSKNKKTLMDYKKKYKLSDKAIIIQTQSKGKTYYRLLYGSYRDRELAYIEQLKLPLALQNEHEPRIKKFGSIQKLVK